RFRRLDIALAVANDKAAFMADRPMFHQVVNHAGLWLSPVVIFEITRNRTLRMVRAITDVVDDGALRRQFGAHPVMQHVERFFAIEAARDAGLVGEEENEIAGLVESA